MSVHVIQGQDHLRLAAVIGTLLALAGVAVTWRASLQESAPLPFLLALLGGALCLRRPPSSYPVTTASPVTMNAVGMTTGAALLVAGAVFDHRWPVLSRLLISLIVY
jgi:hypothetical protein